MTVTPSGAQKSDATDLLSGEPMSGMHAGAHGQNGNNGDNGAGASGNGGSSDFRPPLPLGRVVLGAAAIGLTGALCAAIYYYVLMGSKALLWKHIAPAFGRLFSPTSHFPWIALLTGLGGFLVGLALKFMGRPGEIAAVVDNIHMERGRMDISQTPAMIVVSLLSIVFGGSAGPEAPLVQIIGSLGSWLGDKLRLRNEDVRTFTFCGMGAALGAFFGAPLGGALFALEIPHRRGLEYYEALAPAIIAALLSLLVFSSIVGYEGPIYLFGMSAKLNDFSLLEGIGLGLAGALVAAIFIAQFKALERLARPLEHFPVLLATLGGICIGLIAYAFPLTLFWGETQAKSVIGIFQPHMPHGLAHAGMAAAVGFLLLLALAKMVAVSCTLHGGFRGGFIFPLFFIGACAGMAISRVFPEVSPPVAVLCMMAAVNVAITKTPISTTVILTELSGTSMLPVIAMASFASFLATTRLSLIRTQRSRAVGNSLASDHPSRDVEAPRPAL